MKFFKDAFIRFVRSQCLGVRKKQLYMEILAAGTIISVILTSRGHQKIQLGLNFLKFEIHVSLRQKISFQSFSSQSKDHFFSRGISLKNYSIFGFVACVLS